MFRAAEGRDIGRGFYVKRSRRTFLHLVAGAAPLPFGSRLAMADAYPTRAVHLIEGFGAGSASDINARIIGQRLSERLGQPFVVENRPGANGNIATEAVVRASPDGYALLLIAASNAIGVTLHDGLNTDFIRDIVPVAGISRTPLVMVVNPSVPAKTVPEFIAFAWDYPGKIRMGSAGIGHITHVSGVLFMSMTGIYLFHVPYRGLELTALISGQVQVSFAPINAAIGHINAGRLLPLAVTTAARSPVLPNIPALGEFLPGYEASVWHGVGAPRSTPPEIISKLNYEINAALEEAQVKARFADLGGAPLSMTQIEFVKFNSEETEKWANVIQSANIKPE